MKKNILVFPCGSEIALEVYRSMIFSTHFHLIGGSSVSDHGRFVYDDYIGNIPFVTSPDFINVIKNIVKERNISAIYPAMDSVIVELKKHEKELGCMVVGSVLETAEICLSKKTTYTKLRGIIHTPHLYKFSEIEGFPVFGKPDKGYGSRGIKKITDKRSLIEYVNNSPEGLLCEYLPGEEYTVDCFTNRFGTLLFCGARVRARVMNGISVNTVPYEEDKDKIHEIATKVNEIIDFRGAWFIQLKRNNDNELVLLEVAARLGGSSSLYRGKGVNFAQLTLFDAFGYDVVIQQNEYYIELDRALDNTYHIDLNYDEVFCDLDDCLVLDGKIVNVYLMAFLYQCLNKQKKITLITRHRDDVKKTLKNLRLDSLFDRIIHIKNGELKSKYIDNKVSIFIDDSFSERAEVSKNIGIPVFSLDMIQCLMK